MSYTGFCGSAPVLEQLPQGQWWQQCVGIASGFCLGASSHTFLLGIFNPHFETLLKKRGKKEDKRNLNPYPTIHPRFLGMVIWSLPWKIWGKSAFQIGHKLPLPPLPHLNLSPHMQYLPCFFWCFISGWKIHFIVYDAVWCFFFVGCTIEWLWWFTFLWCSILYCLLLN